MNAESILSLALTVRTLERVRYAMRPAGCRNESEDDMPCREAARLEIDQYDDGPCDLCRLPLAERQTVRPLLYLARRRLRAALDRELKVLPSDGKVAAVPVRRERVWRYHCGFCRKSNCSAASMSRHQEHCTANPNRKCGMCGVSGTGHGGPVVDAVKVLSKGTQAELDQLRNFCEGCPACMLAAIRQSKIEDVPSDIHPGSKGAWAMTVHPSWSYKEEKKVFWEQVNETQNEGIAY